MTLSSLIRDIYYIYVKTGTDSIDYDNLHLALKKAIKEKWPLIKHTDGLYIAIDDKKFDVYLDDKLEMEFYNSYPEALI